MYHPNVLEELARASARDREAAAARPRETTGRRRASGGARALAARTLVRLAARLDPTASEPRRRATASGRS